MLRSIEGRGGTLVEIDFAPFLETARLLYHGPWIAERYVAIRDFFDRQSDAVHPTTRQIIEGGTKPSAAETLRGLLPPQGIAARHRGRYGGAWTC